MPTTNPSDMQTVYKTPILLGYETSESDDCHLIYGEDCTATFFDALEDLAVDDDGDDRNVIIIFHNLKGFDGMFLLKHCYANHRDVNHAVFVGAKVYAFSSDRLTFKDSLCFLPFPLAPFLPPLVYVNFVKDFFHTSSTPRKTKPMKVPYRTSTSMIQTGCHQRNKEDFLRWHEEKRAQGYIFNLQADMKSYCE